VWVGDPRLPAWLKPDISNVIISKKIDDGIAYYHIVEAGQKIDSGVLNWIIHWAIQNGLNILYQISGKHHVLGSEAFNSMIYSKKVY
jgi:hypothetical protein